MGNQSQEGCFGVEVLSPPQKIGLIVFLNSSGILHFKNHFLVRLSIVTYSAAMVSLSSNEIEDFLKAIFCESICFPPSYMKS